MMSRFRSTLLLVLVFVGLFGYFWYFQKDTKPKDDAAPSSPPVKLVVSSGTNVTDIKWNYASISAEIKKDGENKWSFVSPNPGVQVDPDKAQLLANAITTINSDQRFSVSKLSPADVSIDNPQMTIQIKDKDGKSETIKIGKLAVDDSYVYAMKEGGKEIITFSAYTLEELKKTPDELKYVPPTPSPNASSTNTPQY